jgi:hypothetical protein
MIVFAMLSMTQPPGPSLLLVGFFGCLVFSAAGILLLVQDGREASRVVKAITDRDGITLDTVSMETGVPLSRVRGHVLRGIALKKLKGRIIDEIYVSKLIAERVDSDTVRCPHCGAELELTDEGF